MSAFFTLVAILAFSGLSLAASKPDSRGRASFLLAFLGLILFFPARWLVAGDHLDGVWRIFGVAMLGMAVLGAAAGVVQARGPTRLAPLGTIFLAGFLGYLLSQSWFASVPRIDAELQKLREQRAALEERLDRKIPTYQRQLEKQAAAVRVELASAGAAQRVLLDSELREIAEQMVAVDRERSSTSDLIQRLGAEERRLDRLRASQEILGETDASIRADLDRLWQDASAQLSRNVDARLDGGAVDSAIVDAKVAELLAK